VNFSVKRISSEQWTSHLSEDAFVIVFGDIRPRDLERVDFALLLSDEENELSAFITCKEMDSKTLYWQHGGVMPNYWKSVHVYRGYKKFIEWTSERYLRVSTKIENTNLPMLKMALKVGFLVVGISVINGKLYLELNRESL